MCSISLKLFGKKCGASLKTLIKLKTSKQWQEHGVLYMEVSYKKASKSMFRASIIKT